VKVLTNVAQSGLDNHRKFGDLTARDAQKNVVARMKLDYTNHRAMARQLSQLPPGTPVIVESSFGWGWVCDELADRGLSPCLASASKVSAFRKLKSNAKSNRIDSNALSELPLNEDWWRVWLAPREVRDQRELLRYRMGLVECQTQTKLRIHALLHRHGIIQPFSDLFGVGGRKFLALLAESDTLRDTTKLTLKGHLQLLDQLRRHIALATRLFRKHVVHDPVGERLRTHPGIGVILAYTILAEVGTFARFANARKLCSYACLVPLADDSGEMDDLPPKGRHVGHAGRRMLKWAFIEAAHGAVRKDPYFREIFNRHTDGGNRDCNRGYITVAHQLCHIVYVCEKQGRAYRPAAPPAGGTIEETVSTAVNTPQERRPAKARRNRRK
jgi:transposase